MCSTPSHISSQWSNPRRFRRAKSAYRIYMEEEGIPVFDGAGCRDTRELPLGEWKRLGARGTFLFLDGIGEKKGMYLLQVPSGGAVLPEKHMYDEFFFVVEGRGSTEIWSEDEAKRHAFEWQPGTLFMVPINAWHRFVNASSSPGLLLCANNAPTAMNTYQSRNFIFNCGYSFKERFDGSDDFFKAKDEVEAEGVRGRAAIKSNVFADVVNCRLPLDNQRAPGGRRIQPYYHGFLPEPGLGGFVYEYPTGRYSKAHFHSSGAVLVCLRGKGFSFNWRRELGPNPWADGKGELVNVTEYIPGGLVSAAPGGGDWFHQHFGIAKEPLRVLNFWGGPTPSVSDRQEGDTVVAGNIYGMNEGGHTILYPQEDPYVREHYKARLAQEGAEFGMPDYVYDPDYRPSAERPLVVQGP